VRNGGHRRERECVDKGGPGSPSLQVVLVVDPDPERASRIGVAVERLGTSVQLESDPAKAADHLARVPVAVAVVAFDQAPAAGSPELATIRALRSAGHSVIAFAENLRAWEIRARCLPLLAGVECLLDRRQEGFADELASLVRSTFETIAKRSAEERAIRTTMERLGIAAASKSMLDLFRTVLRFSQLSDLPTLITGETGTGKERLARALHQMDPKRSRGPFVPVNCGALTATLAESELFGHRRGAFTGADRDRPGLIRAAQRGILFLDEVGELPEAAQTKLLRVLQEGQVLTVGDDREERVDVRIVAATNCDLAQRVEQGAFRVDLLHRLNVLPLHVPPLRERREDIRPLVDHFVALHAGSMGRSRPTLTPEVGEALEKLEFPGNVRQLENIIRRALVNHTSSSALSLGDLPPEVWREVATDAHGCAATPPAGDAPRTVQHLEIEVRSPFGRLIDLTDGRLDVSLKFCERVLIALVFERARGNQSEMARLLHITPRSVYNKLRRHQLHSPRSP
jgi:DNA-binding NtrC family response regulator